VTATVNLHPTFIFVKAPSRFIYQVLIQLTWTMSKKYKNIRVAVIQEDSKLSFSFINTLKEAEFQLVLEDPLQMELLAWLVSKHTTLYQGKEGEIAYRGTTTPIEGNRRQAALDLIHTLRNEQPVLDNLEDFRKIVLDWAKEVERLEYIFCTHQPEFIQNRV
jgi:hypothetical protein